MPPKLFIPGPTEVIPDLLQSAAKPMMGHRSADFAELYARVNQNLHQLLETKGKGYVFLSTSSGSGLWEAGIRNLVAKKVLCVVNGAFAKRWYEVALANGKEADILELTWDTGADIDRIDQQLATGTYDCLTIVYNETSSGIENPIPLLAERMKKYPEVSFMVDAVSALAGIPTKPAEWGIDLLLASVQKCLAISPGLSICYVSDRAIQKAESIPNRGYYFDLLVFKKYHERNNTPSTPALPQMYQLDDQLQKILFQEGLTQRYQRHEKMRDLVRTWGKQHCGVWIEKEEFASKTVTTLKVIPGFDIKHLNSKLRDRNKIVAGGYGKIKEQTWRIGHMGDHSLEAIEELLNDIEEILAL